MRSLNALATLAGVFFAHVVGAQSCYDTQIKAPSPYLGNGGETIVMMDGSIWEEHSYQYLYLYEYYPTVTLCPSRGLMLLKGKKFQVTRVSGASPPPAKSQPSTRAPAAGSDVIESRIDGDFEGWDGETVFKLANGQIWQQSTYSYTYHYAYRPRVLIVRTGSGYVMQVDGMDQKIGVTRLK